MITERKDYKGSVIIEYTLVFMLCIGVLHVMFMYIIFVHDVKVIEATLHKIDFEIYGRNSQEVINKRKSKECYKVNAIEVDQDMNSNIDIYNDLLYEMVEREVVKKTILSSNVYEIEKHEDGIYIKYSLKKQVLLPFYFERIFIYTYKDKRRNMIKKIKGIRCLQEHIEYFIIEEKILKEEE